MTKSFREQWLLATVAGTLLLAAACGSDGSNQAAPTATPPTEATEPTSGQATVLPVISATTTSSSLSPDRIELTRNVSTRYYAVRGLTTAEIFESIDLTGPRDDNNVKGSGLTAATWGYRWQPQNSPDGCVVASMTITLDIVVTLPRHEQETALAAALASKWEQFEASVAKHEQTHVDIDEDGAGTIRDKMTGIRSAENCDALSHQVDALWNQEQRAIETRQSQFHAQEDARIAALRGPLQSQIDVNRARIASLSTQIQDLDRALAALNTELSNVNNQLDALKAQIDDILAKYPSGNLPSDVFTQYEELRRLYNALAPSFNQIVAQYNLSIAQRNEVAEEHDELVEETNLLVDEFNWTR